MLRGLLRRLGFGKGHEPVRRGEPGRSELPVEPRVEREVEVVAGVDFGTSCTKIVIRLPYEVGEPRYALPVPPGCQAERNPHLWRSELWFTPAGAFHLVPQDGARRLTNLKWKLMQWPVLGAEGVSDVSATVAAAAFLALQMRRTRDWFKDRRPDLTTGRHRLRWSWHVGFPAAALEEEANCERFEVVLAAALDLAHSAGAITLATARKSVQRVSETRKQMLDAHQAALIPEIAAAVASFSHSLRYEDGLYVMIDVGAGTFDCCTFNLLRGVGGATRCSIFAAAVVPLGVEPWHACAEDREKAAQFRESLDCSTHRVIWETRKSCNKSAEHWASGLPLFLIGGGAASPPHRACAESLNDWLRHHLGTDRYPGAGVSIIRPDDQTIGGADGSRLIVAEGLSLPRADIPGAELPDAIPDEPAFPIKDTDDCYIGAERI